MSIATKPTRSIWLPPTDGSEVLYIPFWHPTYGGNPANYISKDKNAISCARTGGTWGKYGWTADGDDLINCGSRTAFDLVNIGTVLMWVNRGVAAFGDNETFIGRESTTGAGAKWLLWYLSGGLTLHYRNTVPANVSLASDAWSPAESTWYLIGFAFTLGTGVTFYIDGVAAGTATDTTTPIAVDYQMYIGAAKERLYLSATVGEVWLYGRVLSAGEVLRNYQRTRWRYVS